MRRVETLPVLEPSDLRFLACLAVPAAVTTERLSRHVESNAHEDRSRLSRFVGTGAYVICQFASQPWHASQPGQGS